MTVSVVLRLSLCRVFLFPLMAQPLSLGLSIIFSTILLCVLVGMFLSSWYGYILFLIYVGGLLVMFAYVAALSPNSLFGGMGPFLFLVAGQAAVLPIVFRSSFSELSNVSLLLEEQRALKSIKISGIELVSPQMVSILVGLAIILLINLVVVVKICYYQHRTLRPFKVD